MGKKSQHKVIKVFMSVQKPVLLFLPLHPIPWTYPALKYYSLHEVKQNTHSN